MLIDFNDVLALTVPGMYNGDGTMTVKLHSGGKYCVSQLRIHPGGSVGGHTQSSGDELNYVLSGTGRAVCDGVEETLEPGVMHVCPKRSALAIRNTGDGDLVLLNVVVPG